MTVRKFLLKTHLYLGLSAAVFFVILGLTGAIIAFEEDMERWLHPHLHHVADAGQPLAEGELIERVNRQIAPARVVFAKFPRRPAGSHAMSTLSGNAPPSALLSSAGWRNWVSGGAGRAVVFVNPADATILGRYTAVPENQRILAKIHQFHMRLAPDARSWGTFAKVGRQVVDYSGLALCILAPTGVVLWWRTKRAWIKRADSWFHLCFDLHNAVGIYAALFLFLAALTGVVVGFSSVEEAIYAVTRSSHVWRSGGPDSTPSPGSVPIGVDRAIQIARQEIPEAAVDGVLLPQSRSASFIVLMRVPEEVTDAVHSSVVVDQYSGKPLQVLNFKKDSLGYRMVRLNRALHTGDFFGLPTHILFSISSLVLVLMVVTGIVIWWKKLAV